jgi:hypothetical protein
MVEIGGLGAHSKLFTTTAAKLEAAGYQVVAAPAASPAGGYDPGWSTPLVAGASVGTLYSVGDLWIGAAGTVTYVDGSTVMAYGHPLDWLGATTGYLTNAWVAGIWHSTYEPYKLMVPAAAQGSITQDRNSGVEGTVGALPVETPVSSSASFAGKTVVSSSQVPQETIANPAFQYALFDFLPTYAAQVPIYKAIDASLLGGSAATTTTVVVSDGARDYTVTVDNLWDDAADVTYPATGDLDNILYTLTADSDGIAPVTVKSVDFTADFSAKRNEARIVSAAVPGGLKIGANDVTVTLAEYGVNELQVRHVTLTLPPGTPLGGGIEVYGPGYWNDSYYGPLMVSRSAAGAASDDRQSVADLVQQLQEEPTNNDILVDYAQNDGPSSSSSLLEGSVATAWVINGDLSLKADEMTLRARTKVVARRSSARLAGSIMRLGEDTTVSLYATRIGSKASRLIATLPVTRTPEGMGTFSYTYRKLKASTRFTAVWNGDDTFLGATATAVVRVK